MDREEAGIMKGCWAEVNADIYLNEDKSSWGTERGGNVQEDDAEWGRMKGEDT